MILVALLLAAIVPLQEGMPATDYDRILEEGDPQADLPQAPPVDMPEDDGYAASSAPPATQMPSAPPTKRQLRDATRRIERMGAVYETLGRCTGSMTAQEVEALLRSAQAQPAAGPYLLGRYERGFRKPRNDDWCARAAMRATRAGD